MVGSKAIDVYALSWGILGSQHEMWSKQHNGKSSYYAPWRLCPPGRHLYGTITDRRGGF